MGTELNIRHDHAPDVHKMRERDHDAIYQPRQSGAYRFGVSGDPLALPATAFMKCVFRSLPRRSAWYLRNSRQT